MLQRYVQWCLPCIRTNLNQRCKTTNSREQRDWDKEAFLTDITDRCGEEYRGIVESVLAWAKEKNLKNLVGKEEQRGRFILCGIITGKSYNSIGIWSNGTVEIQFQYLYKKISI